MRVLGVFTIAILATPLLMLQVVSAAEPLEYNRDIRPILSQHCFKCHGPDSAARKADLRLDQRDVAVKAGVILPAKPTESELVKRIQSNDPDTVMPPPLTKKSLTKLEREILTRWVVEGAKYQKHWSFISATRPQVPKSESQWTSNAVDQFVLRKLKTEGLAPSPLADRATLIRRVTLDLTGLPPSLADIDAFLNDKSENAFEKVVDRLLRSRRYGEHMARYWLDAARYADTNGYQYDLEREQWVWRDWVIHAFNQNMPFDQFTIEQLAGDLLSNATDQQMLATAFHRNHPITIEGGVIDEEYRTEYVVDRVVTTSTVWMGLTMMCGRCHDHKYDPITQREFYGFFAFFNNVPERGLNGFNPKINVASPIGTEEAEELQQESKELTDQFAKLLEAVRDQVPKWEAALNDDVKNRWQVIVPETSVSKGGATLTLQEDKSLLASGKKPATEVYELTINSDQPIHAIRVEALRHPTFVGGGAGLASNANFVLSEFQAAASSEKAPTAFEQLKITKAEADYSQKGYSIEKAIDGTIDRSGWAVDGPTKREDRVAIFTLAKPLKLEAGKLRIQMHFRFGTSHQFGRFRISLAHRPVLSIPADVEAIVQKEKAKRNAAEQQKVNQYLAVRFGTAEIQRVAQRLRIVETLQKTTMATPSTMVMSELASPRKTHVLFRGEYDKPRDEVQPTTPAALPLMPDDAPKNRLGLARWLTRPDHPLTARVTVNRLWQQLFGTGLVKTTEDFGSQGEWPSHPDLLDWLAVEFVESGWDVKQLLKTIVTSSTYRQSTRVTSESYARDPENRLLARGPRLRLDAEVIRDSALFASGLLSSRLGGPSVFPYHPSGLWQEINNRPGYSRTYKRDSGEKLYRRSLYTFWKRTVPPPSMAAFDAPEREFCLVRRSRTNTPLQAFVMLHDPQFVEAARHLAGRMIKDGDASIAGRLKHGFRLCFGRSPKAAELRILGRIAADQLQHYKKNEAATTKLLSVGESRADQSIDAAELAAWTSVARVLLNLSEFVTKP
ncbi:MAG: hypothetical protein CMJ78_07730 [Planctomycetaceae bacterium]|nr:hypothetical protein [Planctomycetaceae bacterium]